MPSCLGVAVVGLGVGEQHALAYARLSQCSLRWLYDLDRQRAEVVRARLGHGRAAESFEAILADRDVDLVSIASYDDAHFAQVAGALAVGKHVFVEKPMCRSVRELERVKREQQRSGSHLASNLVLRAAPLYRWLTEFVRAGDLGDVYAFDGEYLYGRLEKIMLGWRKDVPEYSVMQGGGVHLIDLMLRITGQRPVRVHASGNRICSAGTRFRYNDYSAATFEFASGLIGRITANFGCVHRHQHVVRVFGTRGSFIYDDKGPRLHTSRDPAVPVREIDASPLPASKGDLIPGFVSAIVGGADASETAQQEFDVIATCVAADHALDATGTCDIVYV